MPLRERLALPRGKLLGPACDLIPMVAWTGVCLLVVVAPFETLRPVVRLPGQALTNVEIALFAVLGAWGASAVFCRQVPRWRTPMTWPWLLMVVAGFVAAAAAPIDRLNAFHMVGRSALAFGIFLVAINGATTPARVRTVLMAAAGVGVVVSVLVLLDYSGNPIVLRVLQVFRPAVSTVGAQVRATGPFQYPTIASMYLEIVFAFTLGLAAVIAGSGRTGLTVLLVGVLALVAEGIILTFTRSGLLAMAASLIVVGGLRYFRAGFDRSVAVVALVAIIVPLEIVSSLSVDALRLRLTSETQEDWYRSTIDAPLTASFQTGALTTIPVSITNSGRMTWEPDGDYPFRLSYHWLQSQDDRVAVWEGERTEFAAPVLPGDTVTLRARVRAPGVPGSFRLLWDIEQSDRLWFSTEPGALINETRAAVTGSVVAPLAPSKVLTLPRARVRPGRFVLWRAAARMVADHPLTGVGPDNFRLLYGRYAGIANADPREHSNNMYLEVLTGSGVIGGLSFLWLGWRALGRFASAGLGELPLGAGIAAAGAAIAIHGLADTFLGFTATYILIAITIGLATVTSTMNEHHAHRV